MIIEAIPTEPGSLDDLAAPEPQSRPTPHGDVMADPAEEPGDAVHLRAGVSDGDLTQNLKELGEALQPAPRPRAAPTPAPVTVSVGVQTMRVAAPTFTTEVQTLRQRIMQADADLKSMREAADAAATAQSRAEEELAAARIKHKQELAARAAEYNQQLKARLGRPAEAPAPPRPAPRPTVPAVSRAVGEITKMITDINDIEANLPPNHAVKLLDTLKTDFDGLRAGLSSANVTLHRSIDGMLSVRQELPAVTTQLEACQMDATDALAALDGATRALSVELTDRLTAVDDIVGWYQDVSAEWGARYKGDDSRPRVVGRVADELDRLGVDLVAMIADQTLPDVEDANMTTLQDGQALLDGLGATVEMVAQSLGDLGRHPELAKTLMGVHDTMISFSRNLPAALDEGVTAIRLIEEFVGRRCAEGSAKVNGLPPIPPMTMAQINRLNTAPIDRILSDMKGIRSRIGSTLESAKKTIDGSGLKSVEVCDLKGSSADLDESISLVRRHLGSLRHTLDATGQQVRGAVLGKLIPLGGVMAGVDDAVARLQARQTELGAMMAADRTGRVAEVARLTPTQPHVGEGAEDVAARLKLRGDELVGALKELRKAYVEMKDDRDRLQVLVNRHKRQAQPRRR